MTPGSVSEQCQIPLTPRSKAVIKGRLRRTSLLRGVVARDCVGGIQCASAREGGINFQACSFNHSDISPFRINALRAAKHQNIARHPRLPTSLTSRVNPKVYGRHTAAVRGNCVRHRNVLRSLTDAEARARQVRSCTRVTRFDSRTGMRRLRKSRELCPCFLQNPGVLVGILPQRQEIVVDAFCPHGVAREHEGSGQL